MTLLDALAPLLANPTPVVAFVGGGGKSSALFRLAADLVTAGQRVITTTTHIAIEQLALAPVHLRYPEATAEQIDAALQRHRHLLLTDNSAGERFERLPSWRAHYTRSSGAGGGPS